MSPPNTTKEYAIRKKIKSREKKRKKPKQKKIHTQTMNLSNKKEGSNIFFIRLYSTIRT